MGKKINVNRDVLVKLLLILERMFYTWLGGDFFGLNPFLESVFQKWILRSKIFLYFSNDLTC